jgi:hypothetical protein
VENTVTTNQQEEGNKKNIVFFWVMLLFFFVVLGTYIYFFLLRGNNFSGKKRVVEIIRPDTEFFQVEEDENDQKEIVKIEEEPAEAILTDLDFSQGGDSSFWMTGLLLKGYFHSLNSDTNTIEIKNQLLQSKSLQLLEFNTEDLNSFYCWPETVPSSRGPIDIKTIDLGISSPSATIYNPEEKEISFEQLDVFATESTFIFMQLAKEYDIEKTNYIRKLILIGC